MTKMLVYSTCILTAIILAVSCQKEQTLSPVTSENLLQDTPESSPYVINTTVEPAEDQVTERTCCVATFLQYNVYQGNQFAEFSIINAPSIKYSRYLFEVIDANTGIVYYTFSQKPTGLACNTTSIGVNLSSIVQVVLANCQHSYAVRLSIQQYDTTAPSNANPWYTCTSVTSPSILLGNQICD